MTKIKKLKIYGSDWDTIDGTCIRDYIHVCDVAEGHLKTLEYLNNHKANILKMNIGTGLGTTVLELIETFSRVNNININYKFTSRREGDLKEIVADNSLASSLLNWIPKKDPWKRCALMVGIGKIMLMVFNLISYFFSSFLSLSTISAIISSM